MQPNNEDYEIVSVEPSDPPADMTGSAWHRYVIEQGNNRMVGYQPGSLDAVMGSVQELVARLNDRRQGKRARVQPAKPAGGKKQKSG